MPEFSNGVNQHIRRSVNKLLFRPFLLPDPIDITIDAPDYLLISQHKVICFILCNIFFRLECSYDSVTPRLLF